jgi:hypothetical protein
MEQKMCPVCGKEWDTGSILLHRRLVQKFEPRTVTGYGMCPEHQQLFDLGYVAVVGIDEEKSSNTHRGHKLKMEDVWRTGRIAHVRREVYARMFNVEIPDDLPMVWGDDAVLDLLEKAQKTVERDNGDDANQADPGSL